MTTQDLQALADRIAPGSTVSNPSAFQQFLQDQDNRFQSGQPAARIQPADGGDGGFLDFLTTSLISEGVLDTIRDQGFFGRLGANVLGELTNPLGIASTALLATGALAPVGAGIRVGLGARAAAATASGTRAGLGARFLAGTGRATEAVLSPVATSARGLGPGQILRSPGVLGRSLAAETGVAAGAIAGGGAAQEVGQLIPGPARSDPGQLALGLGGGLAGGAFSANTLNRILDPEVTRLASIARANPAEAENPGLALFRSNFEQAYKTNDQVRAELALARSQQALDAAAAHAAAGDDPIAQLRASRGAQRGQLIDREARFPALAANRELTEVTEKAVELGIVPDMFTKTLNKANEVYAGRQFDIDNSKEAFIELMVGNVPQPAQLEKLRPIIGDAFVDQIKTVTRGRGGRAVQEILQIGAIPRSVAASFDMSSMFRQGGPLRISHPKLGFKAWKEGVKAARNREYALSAYERHVSDPDLQFVNSGIPQQNHMYLHSIDAPDIATRDELVISERVSKMFGIRHSEQFFATDMNHFRMGLMKQRLRAARAQSPEIFSDPKYAERLTEWKIRNNNYINAITGRGSLGFLENPRGDRSGQINLIRDVLSASFWSPRLLVSRFQSLFEALRAGRNLRADDPEIRQLSREIAKDVAIYATGVTGAIGALSFLPGVSAEVDPRSSDFGKVRVGNTRIDPWAGFQQIGRYSTQFITGERKRATDGKVGPVDRDGILGQFLRSKLAPGLPSLTASDLPEDVLISGLTGGGENFIGEPITGGDVTPGAGIRSLSLGRVEQLPAELNILIDQMVPLLAQDIAEALEADGALGGTAAGIGSVFGLGSTAFGDNTRIELVNDRRQGTPNVFAGFGR